MKQIRDLHPSNKIKLSKEIEMKSFNPNQVDIFNEQECIYIASLIKKLSEKDNEDVSIAKT